MATQFWTANSRLWTLTVACNEKSFLPKGEIMAERHSFSFFFFLTVCMYIAFQ